MTTIIDLDARRPRRQIATCVAQAATAEFVHEFTEQGIELADLAFAFVEPFRQLEPDLEQHIRGAFTRWQRDRLKARFCGQAGGDRAMAVAIEALISSFTDRLLELQHGIEPDVGGRS